MRCSKSSQGNAGLAVFAVLAVSLLVASSAEASKALFRVQRSFYSTETITNSVEPPSVGMSPQPPATAYVFNVANRFVLPKSFISYMTTLYCGDPMAGMCFPGYPVSGGMYSYFNGQGRFGAAGPSNPFPGATATTTAVFPTTMGNNLPFDTAPHNAGSGNPATPTTVFSGRYDFSRGGSIQITPGPNKFSGTMRIVYGPNASFYQFITYFTPNLYKAYGSFTGPPSSDETNIGETTSSGKVTRFLLTPAGAAKAKDGMGNYVQSTAHYLHLLAPWSTGMVEIYNVIGYYQTRLTQTGYDNRTANKFNGNISLVRPRLVHTYLNPANPADPIITNFQAARIWRMNVMFLPEPGQIVLLASGVAGLAGLAFLRRRRR